MTPTRLAEDAAAFLPVAFRLADAARAEARRYFRTAVPVDVKPDQSPVTLADREAEAAMRRILEGVTKAKHERRITICCERCWSG